MNPPSEPLKESKFFLRRVEESFPQFIDDLWQSTPLYLLIAAAIVVIARIAYGRYYRKTHVAAKPDATVFWLGWASVVAVGAVVAWVLYFFYKADTATTHTGSATLSALAEKNERNWYIFTGAVFALGSVFVILMYIKDHRSVRWYWAAILSVLRITVYGILCFVFLLPARQTLDHTEKRSRVVVLIDVTPSMTRVSDDVARKDRKTKKRIEQLIETLQDKDIALIEGLLKNNPVAIYAFGSRLDDAPQMIERDGTPWGAEEWNAFVSFDFRPFLTRGLSTAGREALANTKPKAAPPDWDWNKGPKPTTGSDKAEPANWAEWISPWFAQKDDTELVPGMDEADTKTLRENIAKLDRRIDVARAIALGTNVPDSITAAVNRESPNMTQGIIVFSDMRSNLGSDASVSKLRDEAKAAKIPIFTVVVGEDRQSTSIIITDVSADDINSPEDGIKVSVEADGIGLARKTVNVELDLFPPGTDPKKDAPAYTLKDSRKDKTMGTTTPYTITFAPGEPPHGQVEFSIDPARLAVDPDVRNKAALVVESTTGVFKKPVLKEGKWAVRARIPKDENEVIAEDEHVRERLGINVVQKKIRVLLVASAPGREFQHIRTYFDREAQEERATVTLLVQNEAGLSGNLTPNAREQIIRRFPTRLDLSGKVIDPTEKDADKQYNLNEYDLIIGFDPDWTELSLQQAEDIKTWVEQQGGGFIWIGDRINSIQLARVERGDKDSRLLPILDILPVIPDDPIAIVAKQPPPSTKRRLYLHPMVDSDLLKIDDPEMPAKKGKDDKEPENDPVAGWERFFTDRDKYVENRDDKIELFPTRGFYSCYPVKDVKPGAHVLAEFVDEDFSHVKTLRPWIVLSNPISGVRTCFMASGEIYRMNEYDTLNHTGKEYYQRFWAKLTKYMTAKRNVKATRGRVLVSKEVISGHPIRVNAQILGTNSKPYPPDAISPKFRVLQVGANGATTTLGPFELGPTGVDGYYRGQVNADTKQFPPGEYEYFVQIDVPDSPGDVLQGKFQVVRSDLEMDVVTPNFAANLAMASDFDADLKRRVSPDTLKRLLEGLPKEKDVSKLAFKLSDRELLKLIPECCPERTPDKRDIRGPVHDLWDKGVEFPVRKDDGDFWERNVPESLSGKTWPVSWVLLCVVFLLALEWLTRKLLRLA
jgi:hypothetical protein